MVGASVMIGAKMAVASKQLRFVGMGGSSALLNLGILYVLVSRVGLSKGWALDLANALALECGIIYSFVLCRYWVFAEFRSPNSFWRDLLAFHGAVAIVAAIRLASFALMRAAGVSYLLNAMIGIALASVVSYFLYERLVFSRR